MQQSYHLQVLCYPNKFEDNLMEMVTENQKV